MNFIRLTLLSICLASVCLFKTYNAAGIKCGTKDITRPLVKNGDQTLKGEWPFIVALYQFKRTEPFCGGTLISTKHVLSAAHCFQTKDSSNNLLPGAVEVYIGAHNLTANESIVKRNVSEIYVHPEWKKDDVRYDADIAILVLNDSVNFTNHIRPICIPADDDIIDGATIDAKGVIVGWGAAENDNMEEIPRQTTTKALNDSYCFRTDSVMAKMSSARTFCGGDGHGVPNKGDSGGGFFVDSGTAWVQYGIVSATGTNSKGHVAVDSFAIYTNVKLFKHWIIDTVKQSGGEVSEAVVLETIKIDLNCEYVNFDFRNRNYYACILYDLDIRSDNTEIDAFTGSHHSGRTDQDVEMIAFINGTMFYLPSGIGKLLKNLKFFQAYYKHYDYSLNTKLIRRSNFKNLEGLIYLTIAKNDIDILETDSLWDLPRLEDFEFFESKLSEIHEDTFKYNTKLKKVVLYSNQLEFIPENLFQNNFLLEKVYLWENYFKILDERIFVNNLKLKHVFLHSNQLEFLPADLCRNNTLLQLVSLSNNSLKNIPETIFYNNIKLKQVYLDSNYLESIPVNLFENNVLLEHVDLNNNFLGTIDGGSFFNNPNLREIKLESNQLEFLPGNLFQNNVLLKQVSLRDCNLLRIDKEIFLNNPELKHVILSENRLNNLPENLFQNNVLLESIDLNNNLLKIIDERTFVNNLKVKDVFLNSNKLEFLPENLFRNNTLLDIVRLNTNFLRTIHENFFFYNTKIREVLLDSNQLEFIPVNLFKNNLLLQFVNLNQNFLNTIDGRTFSNNPNLKNAYLNSNQLKFLPGNLFQNNILLEQVDLSNCDLSTINEETFLNNPKLTDVLLSDNRLDNLPRNLFRNNVLLKGIYLENNLLTIIDINFTDFEHIKLIFLNYNRCINAYYNIANIERDIAAFQNLTEFQTTVWANCSSVKMLNFRKNKKQKFSSEISGNVGKIHYPNIAPIFQTNSTFWLVIFSIFLIEWVHFWNLFFYD